MEQFPSSKRPLSVKWTLLACTVACVGLVCGVVLLKVWFGRKTAGISPAVRPATEAVLRAQLWSRISGSYWENEMENQARIVSTLSDHERIEFFRVILLSCELDTSSATLFSQLVGKDAESLRRDLRNLKESAEFGRLSATQQKEVVAWIDELKVVAELHNASMLK